MISFFFPERAARRVARRPLPHLLAALLLAIFAVPALAQDVVSGRVVKGGQGVAGATVELHRVSSDTSGMVGRAMSGPGGAFQFTLPARADTATFTVFFAAAMVDGVRYLGPALHPNQPGAGYLVQVYDTTSAQGAVDSLRVTRRDVIAVVGVKGGWEIAEAVRVENPGTRTVVGRGGTPVFGVSIPPGASEFQTEQPLAGASASTGGDVMLVGDRVVAAVPLVPGSRDFLFRYRVLGSRKPLALPISQATDTLALYLRQPAPNVTVEGLNDGTPFEAEGDRYLRFTGVRLRPGARVALRASRPAGGVDPRLVAGAATLLVLGVGAFFALRRRPAAQG
ncbi:MAG TPA: hypothetical protein VGB24_05805 [Longimicrobium sp.]|uniref:hypothetical protein n=1 Tax=Longimicrobium sp. TaxID=2029185 RepID=UPI002ED782A9